MKPENQSHLLLAMTRSRAKMHEYFVPSRFHIRLPRNPATLLSLTVGILGDVITNDNTELSEEKRSELLFAAQYFDSYIESRLNEEISSYLFLLGSATYYLCDLPGCSYVLINKLPSLDGVEGGGLEFLLAFLLGRNFTLTAKRYTGPFALESQRLMSALTGFRKTGRNRSVIIAAEVLRRAVYQRGTQRQLLLGDTIVSVVKKQLYYSTWLGLPKFTGLDIETWRNTLTKKSFIKEFWPSQMLIGERGVLRGKSAIVQMPTSAGKTKSIEIIIRSSFLSGRSDLAVVVAPFRALCSEIKNTLQRAFEGENTKIDIPSDTLQSDFSDIENFDFEQSKLILVLTPEKFVYILRNSPDLAQKVGVLIYDEGHQFDNGIRGVTYELLLASLKLLVPTTAQIVLISAVISNAKSIGDWLLGEGNEVILGNNLLPTYRTIAFASWKDALGRLEFVKSISPDETDYYVPRVLQQVQLSKIGKETKTRVFPNKNQGQDVASYLALKLVKNGSVAIFCGSKASVKSICELILNLYQRGYSQDPPFSLSSTEEVKKLQNLHEDHFGSEHSLTRSCELGVFAHSTNVSQGIRLALEYAMQQGTIKFIVCTSTLAQGVNLPIKYLLVTSFYQAGQSIRTRDFHNLIGRAGRAGIHTEGSIIFTDTDLYDQKHTFNSSWKWRKTKDLLNAANSEPCGSTLLSVFDPLYNVDGKYQINLSPLALVEVYTSPADSIVMFIGELLNQNPSLGFTERDLTRQVRDKLQIISAIESFLIAHWETSNLSRSNDEIEDLAYRTLAYFLSNEIQKGQIVDLFILLAKNVDEKISTPAKRAAYGKTLLGVEDLLEIESWTLTNLSLLRKAKSNEELLEVIWPLVLLKIQNDALKKLLPLNRSYDLAIGWVNGKSYWDLLKILNRAGARIKANTKTRTLTQEHIVDICDGAFGFDITLIVGAIRGVLNSINNIGDTDLTRSINALQKMLKYGLPDLLSVAFYEVGFADRVIAQELSTRFKHFSPIKSTLLLEIESHKEDIRDLLERYPSYYEYVLFNLVIK